MAGKRTGRGAMWLRLGIAAAVLLSAGFVSALIASRVQLACGDRRLTDEDGIPTRLFCVSDYTSAGPKYLLLTNPPDRSGDDISDREADQALQAVLLRLPSGYDGACYRRRGIDDQPTCASASSGVLPNRPIQTVADNHRPYVLFIAIGIGLAMIALALYHLATKPFFRQRAP